MFRNIHIRLTVYVVLWYAAAMLLPEAVGSCLARACAPSPARVAISVAIPVVLASVPVWIEGLSSKTARAAGRG